MTENRPLRVFLCHSSHDKPVVRDLYRRLDAEGWIDAWLDAEKLYPGQDWNFEIEKAVEEADVILVCLTKNSVNKEGYVQRELRIVLDLADYKPEGTLFVIPVRLEECDPPRRLRTWQYADYFPESDRDRAYQRLLVSLRMRARRLDLSTENPADAKKRLEAEERARLAQEQEQRERQVTEERARKELEERARFAKEKEENDRKVSEERQKKLREKKPAETRTPREEHIEKPAEQKDTAQQKPDTRKDKDEKAKSFWTTLPGILTGGAALLTAIAGCVTAITSLQSFLPAAETATQTATNAPITQTPPVINTPAPTAALEQFSIGSTLVSPKDGMILVYVPAGEFTMGSDTGNSDEKPVHTVVLDAFWIDQTEVTNAMFAKFVDETGYTSDAEKSGSSYVYQDESWKLVSGADWTHPLGPDSGISEINNHPVVHVSWNDANEYCSWAERELPAEAEWEKAASWDELAGEKYVYPWGNDFNGGLLNFCDKNCSFSWADKNSNDGFEYTSPVVSYPNGASPYGALDMAGNVWEWVADWYDAYPGNTESNSSYGTTYRVHRGGSWGSDDYLVRSANRDGDTPDYTIFYLGFRCARSP